MLQDSEFGGEDAENRHAGCHNSGHRAIIIFVTDGHTGTRGKTKPPGNPANFVADGHHNAIPHHTAAPMPAPMALKMVPRKIVAVFPTTAAAFAADLDFVFSRFSFFPETVS